MESLLKIKAFVRDVVFSIYPSIGVGGRINWFSWLFGLTAHGSLIAFIYFGPMQYFQLTQQDLDFSEVSRRSFHLFWLISVVALMINWLGVAMLVVASIKTND